MRIERGATAAKLGLEQDLLLRPQEDATEMQEIYGGDAEKMQGR